MKIFGFTFPKFWTYPKKGNIHKGDKVNMACYTAKKYIWAPAKGAIGVRIGRLWLAGEVRRPMFRNLLGIRKEI